MKHLFFALLLLAGTAFAQEDQLLAILKSDAPLKEKADACQELARVGTRQAVPVLATLLADEQLSHMARYRARTDRRSIRGRGVARGARPSQRPVARRRHSEPGRPQGCAGR